MCYVLVVVVVVALAVVDVFLANIVNCFWLYLDAAAAGFTMPQANIEIYLLII